MPMVGLYSASHASNHLSTAASDGGRRPGSRWLPSTARPASAASAETPAPATPHSASPLAPAPSRPAVAGRPRISSRCPGRRSSSAGGAAVSGRPEVSMFRVSTGVVRARRTTTETAWIAKCSP